MAILAAVSGVEVTVQVNGQNLIECGNGHASVHESDATPGPPTSEKYVECVDNAEFSGRIVVTEKYEFGHRNHCLVAKMYADGERIDSRAVRDIEVRSGNGTKLMESRSTYDTQSKQWFSYRPKFAAVSMVDDSKKDRVERDREIAEKLGLIEVKVFRYIDLGNGVYRNKHSRSQRTLEVAEKSLKGRAVSHGTALSKGERIYTPRKRKGIYIDSGPIAVFRFRYLSRDALKGEMIIPRSPSPEAPGLDLKGMSQSEIQRLAQERLRQLRLDSEVKQERKPMIKRESNEVFDLTGDTDKSRPAKHRATEDAEMEVIDLTDAW